MGYGYNTVWHHSTIELSNQNLESLTKKDYDFLIDVVLRFIDGVETFKNSW